METLWAAAAPVTARDVQDALATRDLATTTVLTVLGRLERKGLVSREREGRAHRYAAVASREDHVAELMRDALDAAPDRGAVLARFLGSTVAQANFPIGNGLGVAVVVAKTSAGKLKPGKPACLRVHAASLAFDPRPRDETVTD